MRQSFRSTWRILLLLLVSNAAGFGAVVQYNELGTKKLPYGEAITLTGDLSDFKAEDQSKNQVTVSDWMDIRQISITYTYGSATKTSQATIAGTKWQAAIEPLPENAQVSFIFLPSGNLSKDKIALAIGEVLNDPAYQKALDSFVQAIVDKRPSNEVNSAAETFIQDAAIAVKGKFQIPFKTKEGAAPSQVLVAGERADLINRAAAFSNLPARLQDLRVPEDWNPGAQIPQDLIDALKLTQSAKKSEDLTGVKEKRREMMFANLRAFQDDYSVLESGLAQNISVQIFVEASEGKDAEVSDFQKYAGIDAGAIYIPQAQALMSFVTFNVYFGAVEDSPSSRSEAKGKWAFLQQRLSLTFGVAVGDLSSQANSPIKGTNAFLAGMGFRLNKYFRLTAGDAIYRSVSDNRLKHSFFVGPSVDLSALPNIKGVFGKVKP